MDLILVTGATGFLGHNLVTFLVSSGYPVRALVRPASRWQYLRDLGVELAWGDVTDAESVRRAAEGCRYVVHGAGLFRFWGDPQAFERVNVQGTANVMEAARRGNVEKAVHVSTVAVVGHPPPGALIDEATPLHPADAYQRSKRDGENIVRMYHASTRLPVVILRPGAFYGPWGHYAFNRLFFEDPLKSLSEWLAVVLRPAPGPNPSTDSVTAKDDRPLFHIELQHVLRTQPESKAEGDNSPGGRSYDQVEIIGDLVTKCIFEGGQE